MVEQAIQMANNKASIYHKLQAVFIMFEEGKLKGQKKREMKGVALQRALEGKHAAKLHQFKIFQGLDVSKTQSLWSSYKCVDRPGRCVLETCGLTCVGN